MEVKHKDGNAFIKKALQTETPSFVRNLMASDESSETLSHADSSVLVAQIIEKDGDLKQYGVLGMKWGIRKDRGSRRHTTTSDDDAPKRRAAPAPKKSGGRTSTRRFSDLSDDELKARILRLENEQKLARLLTPPPKKGREFVQNIIRNAGSQVLTTAAVGVGTYALNSAVKRFGNEGLQTAMLKQPKKNK